ncbi:MAG: hypothetical protein M1829_006295 [Trizodia sp. TS-e1964]|nr:MAG: hypothetical protein M1829_006295 [Trizodia sp. TS-e1964]
MPDSPLTNSLSMAGLSVRTSIIVYDDETYRVNQLIDQLSERDIGPGSSQGSSSLGNITHSSNLKLEEDVSGSGHQRNNQTSPGIPKMWNAVGPPSINRRGSFDNNFRGTSPPTSTQLLGEQGSGDVDAASSYSQEDDDWETVIDENPRLSPEGTALNQFHKTGSSLADFSSNASFGPDRIVSIKGQKDRLLGRAGLGVEVLKHPAKENYSHTYRLGAINTPTKGHVLLPNYRYPPGAGFPNRNALMQPIQTLTPANHVYQHPEPLAKPHVNPFVSSPPVVMDSVKAIERTYQHLRTHENAGIKTPVAADFPKPPTFQGPDITQTSLSSSSSRDQSDGQQDDHFEGQALISDPAIDYSDSSWMECFGDPGPAILEKPASSAADGSFTKMTLLGPLGNITGTPQGTGMRAVGSSLANESSPGAPFTSSPSRQPSPPTIYRAPLAVVSNTELSLLEALSDENLDAPNNQTSDVITRRQSGRVYESVIREQRTHQVTDSLLSGPVSPGFVSTFDSSHQSYVPPTINPFRPFHYGDIPLLPIKAFSRHSQLESRKTSLQRAAGYLAPLERPVSYNPTPPLDPLPLDPLPLALPAPIIKPYPRAMHQYPPKQCRLYPKYPKNRQLTYMEKARKRHISRVILCTCLLLPPSLLLYGHGYMDILMLELTKGRIASMGDGEKKVALWLGYASFLGIVVGIVAAMIWYAKNGA